MRLPAPQVPDPADAPPLRWGVLGPGGIAAAFTDSLAGTRQVVAAVGSRSPERARAFAERFDVPRVHASYEDLVADESVDVVYVASPHSAHRDHALLAVSAGKHVLVEKAFTRNAAEAEQVLGAAREAGVFAMEAMWSRFLPHYDVVRRAVSEGLLGRVRTVIADHGQRLYPGGPRRLSDPALAGGALLDLGVYPVSFAAMLLPPMSVTASGRLTDLGVDAHVSVLGTADDGAHAVLTATMEATTPTTASVSGTEARLEVDGDFYSPNRVRLVGGDGTVHDVLEVDPTERHRGLRHEAGEVARRVAEGATESPVMPWAETLGVMRLMDEVRRQVGVVYPGE